MQSRVDVDGELRPTTAPDIGVDQFNDSDSDELADRWEFDFTGDLTTMTSRLQDSDAEFGAVTIFPEPLRPVPGASSDAETEALAAALRAESDDDRGVDDLQRFVEAYPRSRWAPGIHLNLGTISYWTGYFQDALSHWKAAWELPETGDDETSQDIANQALAEYATMNARLGRKEELQELLRIAEARYFMDGARPRTLKLV